MVRLRSAKTTYTFRRHQPKAVEQSRRRSYYRWMLRLGCLLGFLFVLPETLQHLLDRYIEISINWDNDDTLNVVPKDASLPQLPKGPPPADPAAAALGGTVDTATTDTRSSSSSSSLTTSTSDRAGESAAAAAAAVTAPKVDSAFLEARRRVAAAAMAKSLDCSPEHSSTGTTALHLFCAAADRLKMTPSSAAAAAVPDAAATATAATQTAVDASLLELWQVARERHGMSDSLVRTVLLDAQLVGTKQQQFNNQQQPVLLKGKHAVLLWAPSNDLNAVLGVVDKVNNNLYDLNTLRNDGYFGPGKRAVDIGSGLGILALTIVLEYPGTQLISVVSALPMWLLQQVNLRVNVPPAQFQKDVTIHWAALGSREHDGAYLTMELQVPMHSLSSILALSSSSSGDKNSGGNSSQNTAITTNTIDFMKIDCEGCEYNAVPDWTEEELNAIRYLVGEMHFGAIPREQRPSSARSRATHERLCRHVYMVTTCKECCAFLDMEIMQSKNSDTNWHRRPTVREVAGWFCNDFDRWARNTGLFHVTDDSGWLSSQKIQRKNQ